MKNKLNKILPVALAVCLLAGCNNGHALADGEEKVVGGEGAAALQADNYQTIFDELYKSQGIDTAAKEVLYQVARNVIASSAHWTAEEVEAEIHNRIVEQFDTYYSDSYRTDGLFDEARVIKSLVGSGYDIKKKTSDPFVETVDNLIGYNHVYDYLTYDYSDYEAKLAKDIYLDLLDEEYILSQRAATNSSYFKNKSSRKVQYFSWTPETSSEAQQYADVFQAYLDAGVEAQKDFKTIVTEAGGLEFQWKLKQLKDLAKDFAMINARAAGYEIATQAVCADPDYKLPTAYATEVTNYEVSLYANDEIYGFRNVYENPTDYNATEKSEVTAKIASYSSNGAHSIYYGYYLKQLVIINSKMFTDSIVTSDNSSVINSTVNSAVKDLKPMYKETKYIDLYNAGTAVFKADSVYYILSVEEIKDDSTAVKATADEKAVAKVLAGFSSNVKNAIYYYLTSLTEEGKFEINSQELYDYYNNVYGYGEEE